MEGYSRKHDQKCPNLLDLMPNVKRPSHEQHHGNEDNKLELSLGPPGSGDWTMKQSAVSYGYVQNHHVLRSPWQNQQQNGGFGVAVMKEASQAGSIKGGTVVELQKSAEKKAFSPANTAVPVTNTSSAQKRTAPAPVVGWPPIRSFRKNLATGSSSKLASESQNMESGKKPMESSPKSLFVKINMDGVPIGRKVDLKAYDSYEKLAGAVDQLFRGLLAAQSDSLKNNEEKPIIGLLDGSGEYTLVYEDNEGDRLLAGDDPWHMFVSTVKRLRVLKTSELPALSRGSKHGKISIDASSK